MKISHRSIPKFQNGSTFNLDDWINLNKNYYDWYSKIYPNALKLMGDPLKLRNDNWNKEQLSSSHYTTDDLRRSAYNNYLYTLDYNARQSDLQHWADSLEDLDNISDEDLVNRYNTIAGRIRAAREAPQTYNRPGYTGTNRDFRSIFESRSKLGTDNPLYVIGYLDNLEDIEGTSTWLRRMDRYQNKFEDDTEEGLRNRIFYITRPDGTKVKVYKKENGDIALFNGPNNPLEGPRVERNTGPLSTEPDVNVSEVINPLKQDSEGNQTPIGNRKYGFDWGKIKEGAGKIFNNPNLYSLGRLALNLAANEKIYGELLKGINPVLKDTYLTHRQVFGDEATKQAYYRRAAQGLTKAARPFTSDADRQMAYLMEAKRVGDELRALGDSADNQEIRRTSDESNQHQWTNTLRATEVANYNTASINQAKSLRHNLLALKYAANASSVDNALKEYQSQLMKRQAELLQYDDLIYSLLQLLELLNDPRVREARKEYQAVLDKHKLSDGSYDYYNDEVLEAKRKYDLAQLTITIENRKKWRDYYINNRPLFIKLGYKITKKVKNDSDSILYMSTRDVVKHFREMTKLSSDALDRRQPKIERLTSHPKGSTRRYLLGGVAPFLVYTPITLGGQNTTTSEVSTSSTKSSSSKDDNEKNALNLVKDLFKELAGKGLQIDVNTVYSQINNVFSKAKAFGEELNAEDIQLMYLSAIRQINEVLRSKDIYDKAKAYATQNDALDEYAVTSDGQYVVLDTSTGKISFVEDLSKLSKGLVPIKNQLLLYLREYSPELALQKGNFFVENIINNGMGINKIGNVIKSLAGSIGSVETKIEGLTEVESKRVKAGLQLLAQTDGTPNGIYKVTNENKNSSAQIEAALNYIENMLSPSLKAILNIHGGTRPLIASFLSSQEHFTLNQSVSPLTGKASDSSKSKSGSDDITPAVALAMGLGDRQTVLILDKTSDALKIDVVSLPLLDSSHNAMANATLYQVGNGDYAGLLDLGQATMGGVKIDTNSTNEVLIDRGRIYSAELPIDKLAALNGIYKPDLRFLKNIEKADAQIREKGITNRNNLSGEQVQIINKIYQDNQLPIIYTINGDGLAVLTSDYRRFAILHATAPESVFLEDMSFNDGIIEASQDDIKRFESMMREVTNNDKYKFDEGLSILGKRITGEGLYKGLLYIPMSNSTISALSSTGYKASPETYNLIEAADLQAEFIRSSGYQSAGSWKTQ